MSDLGGKLQGTLVHKEAPKQGQWPSQRFVVKVLDDRGYENFVQMEAQKKALENLTPIQVGEEITVSYNIRGRKYNDRNTGEEKYFTLISAWALDAVKQQTSTPAAQNDGPPLSSYDNAGYDADTDIPF